MPYLSGWTKALNAVTTPGTSVSYQAGSAAFRSATLQTIVTGAPASISCKLQGSLDGTNWADLATSTSTTGDQQYVVDKPQRFLRANLGTLSGGTTPTVTAYISAGG